MRLLWVLLFVSASAIRVSDNSSRFDVAHSFSDRHKLAQARRTARIATCAANERRQNSSGNSSGIFKKPEFNLIRKAFKMKDDVEKKLVLMQQKYGLRDGLGDDSDLQLSDSDEGSNWKMQDKEALNEATAAHNLAERHKDLLQMFYIFTWLIDITNVILHYFSLQTDVTASTSIYTVLASDNNCREKFTTATSTNTPANLKAAADCIQKDMDKCVKMKFVYEIVIAALTGAQSFLDTVIGYIEFRNQQEETKYNVVQGQANTERKFTHAERQLEGLLAIVCAEDPEVSRYCGEADTQEFLRSSTMINKNDIGKITWDPKMYGECPKEDKSMGFPGKVASCHEESVRSEKTCNHAFTEWPTGSEQMYFCWWDTASRAGAHCKKRKTRCGIYERQKDSEV